MKSIPRLQTAALIAGTALFIACALYFDIHIAFPRG